MKKNHEFFLEEELTKKEMDYDFSKFHVIPIPLEKTISFGRGTSKGPKAIIKASNQLEREDNCPCELGIFTHNQLDCLKKIKKIFKEIENIIQKIANDNKIPVSIGGEHSLTFSIFKGLKKSDTFRDKKIGIIQFDAHADLRKEYNGSRDSHATVMYKLAKEKVDIFQFGVRSQSKEEILFRKKFGICHNSIKDYRNKKKINLPKSFPKYVYITFDSDCLDPSIMPATGTPVPNGLYYDEVFLILEELCKNKKIIGFDYVEFSPIENFHAYDFISASIIYDLMKFCIKSNNLL